MVLIWEQIQAVVLDNPAKEIVKYGREMADKLMLHLHGVGMDSAIHHAKYFASQDLFTEQKRYAQSNIDLFGRLLQQEDMVFTARGGSSNFSLSQSDEDFMNETLSSIRYGISLRKWIRNFALPAYRSDPMGIIFIEAESTSVTAAGMREPAAYPTYKSIYSIYDYATTGRKLEYVVFRLTASEARSFGVVDEDIKTLKGSDQTNYFRVVDDEKDLIVKLKDGSVSLVNLNSQKNPISNRWKKTPGFIISDLMVFNKPNCFVSPLHLCVELADCFLQDRSVRNLQKKFHGFAKAVEPILKCSPCGGTGYIDAAPCPHCSEPGAQKGTGYKKKTGPADVARFPLDIIEKGFDFKRVFGYVTPDIESWNKQDMSLEDIEELIEMTYWGTVRMKRPEPGGKAPANPVTATESTSNDRPKEARLNMTADWVESTENMIADYIGQFWFPSAWKKSSIVLGRDYILKTAEELMDIYLTLRTKGAPDFSLDEALRKYYQAKYMTNPNQLQKYLKMLDVEPFPHISISVARSIITDFDDYNCKLYFGEWANTIADIRWITTKAAVLREELRAYVKDKGIKEPAPENQGAAA